MILIERLSNAKKGRIYFETRFEGSRITKFFERVEYLVNAKILGTEDNVSEWNCPCSPNGKEIGAITMDNVWCRQIIDKLELLIEELCCGTSVDVGGPDRKEK